MPILHAKTTLEFNRIRGLDWVDCYLSDAINFASTRKDDSILMAYDHGDTLTGLIIGQKYSDGGIMLPHIKVSRNERGHGVGGALINSMISYADERGQPCWLEVSPSNQTCISLCKRFGFAVNPSRRSDSAGYLIMERAAQNEALAL